MKNLALAALGSIIALGAPSASKASDPHLDDLAFELRNQTAVLVREIRYGYRYHPEFAHLYEDAVEMARHADYIHEIAHHRHPVSHLAREVNALDELFHHVEEVVAETNNTHLYRINRFHQRRACQIMAAIEGTLHHLLDDVTPVTPVTPLPVTPAPPVFPSQPVLPSTPTIYRPTPVIHGGYPHGGGFTYRSKNGRFSITVGR